MQRGAGQVDADEILELLVDGVTDYAIFMLDPRGHVASWNTGAARTYGYSVSDIVGQSFMAFYTPEDVRSGKPERELRLANEFGRYEEEGVRVRKDGSKFWASVVVTALRGHAGELRGFAKVTRDITNQRLSAEALRESAAVLKAVFETVVDGIITIDERGTIISLNPAVERIFGYEAHELIGQNVKMLMPEPYYGEHDTYILNYRNTGNAKIIGIGREVEGRRKDGSVFPMELAVGEARFEETRLFTGTIRDITERKRAEEALHELNRTLEARVVDRTAQLEGFCYSIAHDLRQHIRGVNVNARMMLEDLKPRLDEEEVENLVRMQNAARQMASLVDDLLHYSRTSIQDMRFEAVDMSALAKEVAERVLSEAAEPVEVVIEEGLRAEGDPALLGLVLQNLLENAWKYRSQGRPLLIEVGCKDKAFFVRDNGIGFDMEYAERVFRPFERLHRSTDVPGSGIGLATVKRLIERHGGSVWVSSAPGEGSAFYFTVRPTDAS